MDYILYFIRILDNRNKFLCNVFRFIELLVLVQINKLLFPAEAFVIHAWCEWCLFSAGMVLLLLLLAVLDYREAGR